MKSRTALAAIKAGYNFNLHPNHWAYMEGTTRHHVTTGADGLFVQLIFGGLLKLEKSRED